MYAVIATGGKQYRVAKDTVLKVEKLDALPGETVEFADVRLVGEGANVKIGSPPCRWHQGAGHGGAPRPGRQGGHRQVSPSQALPASGHAPSALHGSEGHGHQRGLIAPHIPKDQQTWHTKKLAAVPETAAIRTPSGWASSASVANSSPRQHSGSPAGHPDARGSERRRGHGPHFVRARGRPGAVFPQGRRAAHLRQCAARGCFRPQLIA